MLPPAERLVDAQLHRYIRDKLYWVLHAPRQTGKTTFLQSWMREINAGDEAIACYVSLETCQGVPEPERAMPAICDAVKDAALKNGLPVPVVDPVSPQAQLNNILSGWAKLIAPKPLVVLFDEVDVLAGETLISFLRQLRSGFAGRGIGIFPVSIALVGMRDLKDYITKAKDGAVPNPGSPFNIKEDSVVLSNFHNADIAKLFAQRTEETGQQISREALDYVYDQSRGQPWIVNSLFKRAVMRVLDEDSRETITLEHIRKAREQIILARETHLDSLAVRMEDPKIRKVMETILSGESDPAMTESEGFRICVDLGLVTRENGTPMVANPIYREVLARHMTFSTQDAIPAPDWQWEKSDGSLDMDTLLKEFQRFWRKNSEIWEQKSDYTEAFPHLLLQAFLQRILNGGGRIEREYAAGRGRMDLAVEYNNRMYIIEIKLIHSYDTPEEIREEGLRQIGMYRDKTDPSSPAYLLIFDRRPEAKQKKWDERLTWSNEGTITVIGL
ncbi:hypothetical protein AGMMS49546_15820 [Spirochaetia bacterium]|nr:hypothetical protein AGMMS49546_15820 [Spirochaetia bacterium]